MKNWIILAILPSSLFFVSCSFQADQTAAVQSSLTVELAPDGTKTSIGCVVCPISGAVLTLVNPKNDSTTYGWKKGDSYVFSFNLDKKGQYTLKIKDWDTNWRTNSSATNFYMDKKDCNYKMTVRLGGNLYFK